MNEDTIDGKIPLPKITPELLAGLIRDRREQNSSLTLELISKQSGVSAATLSRLLNNKKKFELERRTAEALALWLGVELVKEDQPSTQETLVTHTPSTPDVIAVHLRADPKLKPEDAEFLAQMLKKMYKRFSELSDEEIASDDDI